MAEETNTRVSLQDHVDAKFESLEKLNVTRFDALKQEVIAGNKALEQKIEAGSAVLKQDIDARSELEQEKWDAHKDVHERERGIVAVIGAITTAAVAWFGGRYPK